MPRRRGLPGTQRSTRELEHVARKSFFVCQWAPPAWSRCPLLGVSVMRTCAIQLTVNINSKASALSQTQHTHLQKMALLRLHLHAGQHMPEAAQGQRRFQGPATAAAQQLTG